MNRKIKSITRILAAISQNLLYLTYDIKIKKESMIYLKIRNKEYFSNRFSNRNEI